MQAGPLAGTTPLKSVACIPSPWPVEPVTPGPLLPSGAGVLPRGSCSHVQQVYHLCGPPLPHAVASERQRPRFGRTGWRRLPAPARSISPQAQMSGTHCYQHQCGGMQVLSESSELAGVQTRSFQSGPGDSSVLASMAPWPPAAWDAGAPSDISLHALCWLCY